ncbi:putative nucleoporin [Cryptosporidium felis]|nr:putative nucleoporin [Cryptosporidium felis]
MPSPKKGNIILLICILLSCFPLNCVSSILNRKIDPALALLPWTSENQSSIEITASHGCYIWSFGESEYINIENIATRIDELGNNCTDIVKITPTWPYENIKGIFTMVALDIYTKEEFRSEVHVAKVESIKISTSSKRIRLNSLESLYAIGFDSELNTFTSLSGLNITWELDNENLTSEKTKGDQILVVGSKVGSTNVSVKIDEKNLSIHSSVTILIEEPFKIIPYIRRVPYGSLFSIQLAKDGINNKTNFFNEKYHHCMIDESEKTNSHVFENNKILIGNYNGQNVQSEYLVSTTCIDKRVEGSTFTSLIYFSFPKGIKFSAEDGVDIPITAYTSSIEDFIELYFIEGEQIIEKFGIFNKTIQNNELTLVEGRQVYIHTKIYNHGNELYSIPTNANFNYFCINGCNNTSIKPVKSKFDYGKNSNGFFRIIGNSLGTFEILFVLDSIGEMKYADFGRQKLPEIKSILRINVIKNISTTFTHLPLVLYPGEQEMNIKDKIKGGKGPFRFCAIDQSIVNINFIEGTLKTNYSTGSSDIIVYDVGLSLNQKNNDQLDCETLKTVNGLKIPVVVTYIDGFYLELMSSEGKIYNNTIYAMLLQKEINLDIKALLPKNLATQFQTQFNSTSTDDFSYTKQETLNLLKLYDPCKILSKFKEIESQIQINSTKLDSKVCSDILLNLRSKPFTKLISFYDKNLVEMNIFDHQIKIKLNNQGSLFFERFLEIGIEFVLNSKVHRKTIFVIELFIHIFEEISFFPLTETDIFNYYQTSKLSSNHFYIEKNSDLNVVLYGGIRKLQEVKILVENDITELLSFPEINENELNDSPRDNDKFIQIIQLEGDGDNQFLIKCKGHQVKGFIEFTMKVLNNDGFEIFRMSSSINILCSSIDHINMFWINPSQPIGKYTCNTRNENCLVFHFNTKEKHRFVALAFEQDNNPLLSYNYYKMNWKIENVDKYSIQFPSEVKSNVMADIRVFLESKYYMKDINIEFEASLPCNHEATCRESESSKLKIITKGIFTRPPTIISPNMKLSTHEHVENYHSYYRDDTDFISLGSWYLIEGQHQLGIIHGTNNFNIFINDHYKISNTSCDNFTKDEKYSIDENTVGIIKNLYIYFFCLDSHTHSINNGEKVTIYIEDELILPKLFIKKELFFSKLATLQLVWLDRFGNYEYKDLENPESHYLTFNTFGDAADHSAETLYYVKVPYKYIWFLQPNDYNHLEIGSDKRNSLPCINQQFCIIDKNSESFLILILLNENGVVLEPWQDINHEIEIEKKIKYFSHENNIEKLTFSSNELIDIVNISSTIFKISKICRYGIEIQLNAKILDTVNSINSNSNVISLIVYDSIELEPMSKNILLFPYGSAFKLNYKGGPVGFNNFWLEWNIKLQNDEINDFESDIISIKDNQRLIIEPLGVLGTERVYIKCYLRSKAEKSNLNKVLIFSEYIDIHVDLPKKIDIFSPDPQFIYFGYPKLYRLRVWNNENNQLPHFHNSQFIPSSSSKCIIKWSVNESKVKNDDLCENNCNTDSFGSHKVCILVSNNTTEQDFGKEILHENNCKYNFNSPFNYYVNLNPLHIGESELKVRLECIFGNKERINLEGSQKINVIESISSIENAIWIIRDSYYDFIFPKEVFIESNNLNITHLNELQLLRINTKDSPGSLVIYTEENRFKLENGRLKTILPLIVSVPEVCAIEIRLYNDFILKISILLMNSMGIKLYPNTSICNSLQIHIISFQNHAQKFVIEGENYSQQNITLSQDQFKSKINHYCQFFVKLSSNELMYSETLNHMNGVSDLVDSCFIIQVYFTKEIIGTQPFCFKSDKINFKHEISDHYTKLEGNRSTAVAGIDDSHEFEVFAGSTIHLNPLKWKFLNIVPNKLDFCVFVGATLKGTEKQIIEELSNITGISKFAIKIRKIPDEEIKSLDILEIPSNEQFSCISITKRVDPFDFWILLMEKSTFFSKPHGIYWFEMNRDKVSENYNIQKFEYRWELTSQMDSIKLINNELLIIPEEIHTVSYIKLRLSNFFEINIKITPFNKQTVPIFNKYTVKEHGAMQLNNQFSFSLHLNTTKNLFFNNIFSNIYYSSPIKNIKCKLSHYLLREMYRLDSFWIINAPEYSHLVPTCRIIPIENYIPNKAIDLLINIDTDLKPMFIQGDITDTSFEIEVSSFSSKFESGSISIGYFPILVKNHSSALFSLESTLINQGWFDDSYNIYLKVPYFSENRYMYKLPIQISFWFGYPNTNLIAYSIRGQNSDIYQVDYSLNKFIGTVKIIRSGNSNKFVSEQLEISQPLEVVLEFVSNHRKHKIEIYFEYSIKQSIYQHSKDAHSKLSKIGKIMEQKMQLIFILIVLAASLLYLKNNREQFKCENKGESPFRKLNTKKW